MVALEDHNSERMTVVNERFRSYCPSPLILPFPLKVT